MDFRKIISFGNSSYVVSLPKTWIEKNNLKKGDLIYINEEKDSLTIFPKFNEEGDEVKEINIGIDGKSEDVIKREIISSYIQNYNIINISGKELSEKSPFIRSILHNLMAIEIIEQTSNKMVAKDFVNLKDINIISLIKKIDLIIRSMLTDVKIASSAPRKERVKIVNSLQERDIDINRISFLIYRSIRYFMNHPKAMKLTGMSEFEMLNAWLMVNNLERLGDDIKRAGRFISASEKFSGEISKILERNHDVFVGIMKCYYSKDIASVYKLACEKNIIIRKIEDLFKKHNNKDNENTEFFIKLIEKLKAITVNVHNISRVVHN